MRPNLQNNLHRKADLPRWRNTMSLTQSPYLLPATMSIMLVVGWVVLLSGGITGQSFGISAFTAPSPRYNAPMVHGYDYGAYTQHFLTNRFLEVQRLCAPNSNPTYSFPPNQHECCRQLCNDVCYGYNAARPGGCLNPCIDGCSSQALYQP